jgi:transcriptional regulator with XRE-family HTH domain
MDKELGYKVKRMRELRGVRQDFVAKALGIKQGYYSEMEAGKHEISEERLDKIAEAIGTSAEAFEAYDERYVNNIINNNNGNVNAAGATNPTFYSCEDVTNLVEMAVEKAVAPWKELVASQKEEIQFLRKQIEKHGT